VAAGRRFALLACALGLCACSWFGGPKDGTFRGVYVTAFEASNFRPCGGAENWWLTDESGDLSGRLPPVDPSDFSRAAFLRIKGRRSSRGQHGHLGSYPYAIAVHEVLEVAADTTGKCL